MRDKNARAIYSTLVMLVFPDRHHRKLLTSRRWRHNNRLRCSANVKEYARTHRCQINTWRRQWEKDNRDKRRTYESKKRAIKRSATVGSLEPIKKIYARCKALCKYGFDVVVDHAIPLSKGGSHSADNLQIIYRLENLRKWNRLNYQPRVVFL